MNITWEDLLLETLPFREELLNWCKIIPEFKKGLKVLASERFLHLGAVMISHPPKTNDQVIGVYAYDYKHNPPLFKQDFIVDVNQSHKEFILYTGFPNGAQSTKYVKHINDFFSKYGENDNYANSHHLTFDQLPEDVEIRRRAKRMIEEIKGLPDGIVHPPQEVMADHLAKIREAKKGNWVEFRKLCK